MPRKPRGPFERKAIPGVRNKAITKHKRERVVNPKTVKSRKQFLKKSKSLILGGAKQKVSKTNPGKAVADKNKKHLKTGKGFGKKTLSLNGKFIKGKKPG